MPMNFRLIGLLPRHTHVWFMTQTDGRVIHIHEFIGVGLDPDECARTALDIFRSVMEPVKSLGLVQSEDLKVLHVPRDIELRQGAELRVDMTSNKLVSSEPRHPMADAIERSRARRMLRTNLTPAASFPDEASRAASGA